MKPRLCRSSWRAFTSTHPLMLPSTSPREALLACPPFPPWNLPSFTVKATLFFPCSSSDPLFSRQGAALAHLNRRDGVVVRASASQSVDLGFIPLVESYQKTLKNGIRSFPAWRSAFMGGCGEQAGKFACCVLGQGT